MELLTSREAAAFMKISIHTLEKWRVEGTGPSFVRAGRLVRYDREVIETWLLGRTVKGERSTPEPERLTPQEAVDFLREHKHTTHKITLAKWRGQNKGPAYEKDGTRIFYAKKVLEAWVKGYGKQEK